MLNFAFQGTGRAPSKAPDVARTKSPDSLDNPVSPHFGPNHIRGDSLVLHAHSGPTGPGSGDLLPATYLPLFTLR